MRTYCLLFLCPLLLCAQSPTTITATLSPGTSFNGIPDLPNGTCSIQPVTQFTSGSYTVTGPSSTVSFTAGLLSVQLLPTDTATPSPVYYSVTCSWPPQVVSGHQIASQRWATPHIWQVPTSATPVDLSSGLVEVNVKPGPSYFVGQSNFSGNPYAQGLYSIAIAANGTVALSEATGYSINLMTPQLSDSGLLQKTEDKGAYYMNRVSCSTDSLGSVQVNLDIRSASTPNTPGTSVLGTPLTCSAATAQVVLSPPVLVPAGSPVTLDLVAITGNPSIVRVHISR